MFSIFSSANYRNSVFIPLGRFSIYHQPGGQQVAHPVGLRFHFSENLGSSLNLSSTSFQGDVGMLVLVDFMNFSYE